MEKNEGLTDLSALYVAEIFKIKNGGAKITHLNISNTKMQAKAGLFIGEALMENPDYAIAKIIFKNIRLEENGLYRMIEAVNANKNIT